jgi:hypothetical protein
MGIYSPQECIEVEETFRESSSILVRMPLREKYCRLIETLASPHVSSVQDHAVP